MTAKFGSRTFRIRHPAQATHVDAAPIADRSHTRRAALSRRTFASLAGVGALSGASLLALDDLDAAAKQKKGKKRTFCLNV